MTKSTKPTQATKPQSAFRIERERLYHLLMNAPASVAIISGPDLVFELANPHFCQLIGADSDIAGKPMLEVVPDIEQSLLEIINGVAKKGKRFIGNEIPILLDWENNGTPYTKYLNFVYEPIFDDNKKPDGLICFANEVTTQVIARQKIEESEDKYRNLFNAMDQGFCIIELLFEKNKVCDYVFLEVNPAFEMQTGTNNPIGKKRSELAPKLEAKWLKIYSDVARTGKPKRFTDKAEATGRWFDVRASRIGSKDSRKVAVLFTDITERRRRDEEIKESELRFRQLSESVPQLVWITDASGSIEYLNQNWYSYTGTTPKSMLNKKWADVLHLDDNDTIRAAWSDALNTGNEFMCEYRLRAKDGSYHWFLARGVPQLDKKGKIKKWYGTCTYIDDVKRRHEVEKRMERLTEQRNALIKINKTKDEFIALASHQLRTPATAVKQYISLLMDEYAGPVSVDQIQFLQTAYNNNERQLSIINDLLKTAQIDSSRYALDSKMCNIVKMMKEVTSELESALELKNQIIIFKPSSKNIQVAVDYLEVKLVLINLVENASKYSYPGTQITITVQQKSKYVEIAIADTGVGIAKENIKKIFEKFTRIDNDLSDTVNGSGLGLYWVKRIIKLHKGSIKVSSTIKKGSVFTVCLPL